MARIKKATTDKPTCSCEKVAQKTKITCKISINIILDTVNNYAFFILIK